MVEFSARRTHYCASIFKFKADFFENRKNNPKIHSLVLATTYRVWINTRDVAGADALSGRLYLSLVGDKSDSGEYCLPIQQPHNLQPGDKTPYHEV